MLDRHAAALKRNQRFVGLGAIAAAAAGVFLTTGNAHAQTTVFSDNFGNGSTLNSGNAPTSNSTSYDLASGKAEQFPATISTGSLNFSMFQTTSGVMEAQALFTTAPVVLTNTGDTLNLQVNFTDVIGIIDGGGTDSKSSQLAFGLYSSGGVAPLTTLAGTATSPPSGGSQGIMSNSFTNATTGGAAGWQGYFAQYFEGGPNGSESPQIDTRPAQTGPSNTNQELLGNGGSGSSQFENPKGSVLQSITNTQALLTDGSDYTEDFSIELTAPETYTITTNLYPGSATSGSALFSITATGVTGTEYVNGFDGLAFGWRETSDVTYSQINVNSISVTLSSSPVTPSSTWTGADNNGSWADANNWSPTTVPDGAGTSALFASTTGTTTITLDGNQTVGSLTFNNSSDYTLTSGSVNSSSALIMDNGASSALITSLNGAAAGNLITAPIVLNSNTTLNSTTGTAALVISGDISSGAGDTTGVTITGGGFISFQGSNSYTGTTTIDAGGTLKLQSPGAIPAGTAIVNDGSLSIQYGNILAVPIEPPVVIGALSGSGTLAVGSNKNAYLQLAAGAGTIQQGELTMMLTNTTPGVEAVLDLNGQNATFGSIATGSAGLNVIGNSGSTGSVLTIAPSSTTASSTFSGTLQDGINGSGSTLALSVPIGSLFLTGSNSYSGNTTIGSGAYLQVSTMPTALAPASKIVNNGELDVEVNSVAANISGSGSLVIGTTTTSILQLAGGSHGVATGGLSGVGPASSSAENSAGPSTVAALTVNTGSSLDLTYNALYIDYGAGADPIATIVSYLTDGYNAGWSAGEIMSSAVATLNASQSKLIYAVGYADAADGSAVTSLSSGVIEVLPTLAGDAKMQGNVVFGDFQILAQYFGKSGGWDEGNFKYGGTVNFGDFQILAQNFGSSAGALTAGEFSSLNSFAAEFGDELVADPGGGFTVAVVPEPASLGMLSLAGIALLRRSRRKTT